jgi:hypothetical protein
VAHWNEIRDEWRVGQARAINLRNTKEIVDRFEQTGDIVYWEQFISLLRADVRTEEFVALRTPLRRNDV